jgi:hypothetical protein
MKNIIKKQAEEREQESLLENTMKFWQGEGLEGIQKGEIIWVKSSQEELFNEDLTTLGLEVEYAGNDSTQNGIEEYKTEEGVFFPWRIK